MPLFLYRQLADELRQSMLKGDLAWGEKLPSLRAMSRHRRLSLTTVKEAYDQLLSEGMLEARAQVGYFVAYRAESSRMPLQLGPVSDVHREAFINEIVQGLCRPGLVMLGSTSLRPELLPNSALARLMHRCTKQPFNFYAETQGLSELRQQIARRSIKSPRPLTSNELVITAGCTEAVAFALRCVAKAGELIAIESPVYYSLLQTLEGQGMRALAIPTSSRQGLNLESLEAALESYPIKALVSVPSFHNPLGACLATERRRALVEMLTSRGIPMIENDVFGELYYASAVPSLYSFDRTGLVIYCSSFSKTLARGLRIGWAAPGRFKEAFMQQKRANSLTTATLPQQALAAFLAQGDYDRHLRKLRKTLQSSMQALYDCAVAAFPPGTQINHPTGGLMLWVEMPPRVRALDLFDKALELGIGIAPGPLFALSRETGQDFGNCIRLSCPQAWDSNCEAAVRTLGQLAHRASRL